MQRLKRNVIAEETIFDL